MDVFALHFRSRLNWRYLYSADGIKKNVQLVLLFLAVIATHSGYALTSRESQSLRQGVLWWLYIFIAFIIVTQILSITCYTINLVHCYETIGVAFFFICSCYILRNLPLAKADLLYLVMFPWLAVLFQIHHCIRSFQKTLALADEAAAGPLPNGNVQHG